MAKPRPFDPPVTMATRPERSNSLRPGSMGEVRRCRWKCAGCCGGKPRLTRSVRHFRLNLPQPLFRVAELLQGHPNLLHQRQVQAAHLPIRLAQVVEHAPRLDLPAAATEE